MNRKIKKIIGIVSDSFYFLPKFGMRYSFMYFWSSIVFRKYAYKTRLLALQKLEKKFGYIFENNEKLEPFVFDESQKNIFIFWAQGFEKLPYLQMKVIDQIRRNYPDFSLRLIDLKNYKNYVSLSQRIESLFEQKKITIQTFSDILRFNLLNKYGGVWCDATLLFFGRIPIEQMLSQYGFYSINHKSKEKEFLWGKVYPVTYTTFFLCATKNNQNMRACVLFYNEYYQKYSHAIDYFMNDYMLILCMKHHIGDDQLSKIPFNDGSPFYLFNSLEQRGNIELGELLKCPQKLNWRSIDEDSLIAFFKVYEGK